MIRQEGVEEFDHYLDGFSTVGPPKSQQCRHDLDTSLETCEEVGCPVAGEKTEGPSTKIILLGNKLDSVPAEATRILGHVEETESMHEAGATIPSKTSEPRL